jgi:NAD(P)-dependent dehydrogenase (short-subunit alcohol dehydrogenase family)
MSAPFMTTLKVNHHDTYPAISPSRPELSLASKTVVLTGAGSGIGRHIALEAAKAGASHIHIIGRTAGTLNETKQITEKAVSGSSVTVYTGSISDETAMKEIASKIGPWDVLIANAGYLAEGAEIGKGSLQDWWAGFDINVRGAYVQLQAFLPTRKPGASIVGTSTLAAAIPVTSPLTAGKSSYVASKLAMSKVFEYAAAEHDSDDVQIVIIHPGVIATDMAVKAKVPEGMEFDSLDLSAHFALWAASKEAKFAHGKFLSVNWDVNELKEHKEKFEGPQFLTFGLLQ